MVFSEEGEFSAAELARANARGSEGDGRTEGSKDRGFKHPLNPGPLGRLYHLAPI